MYPPLLLTVTPFQTVSNIVSLSAGYAIDLNGPQIFHDVPPGATYFGVVNALYSHHAIGGYVCGPDKVDPQNQTPLPCDEQSRPYFMPNNNATRAQLSQIVARVAGLPEDQHAQRFQDVPPMNEDGTNVFYAPIQELAAAGAISGYSCGRPGEPCVGPQNLPYFHPGSYVTRGQASKIITFVFFPDCLASSAAGK